MRGIRIVTVIFALACLILKGGKVVYASGFHITSIGETETGGRPPSRWWYSGNKPILRGESLPGSEVIIDIDGVQNAVNADSAGDWVYTPIEGLVEGNRQVTVKNNGSEVKFELIIGTGNVDWGAVEKGTGDSLPTVGVILPTIWLLGSGGGLTVLARRVWAK